MEKDSKIYGITFVREWPSILSSFALLTWIHLLGARYSFSA